MVLRLVLLTEIISMVISIYRIYGKKIQFKIETIILILLLVFILEVINKYAMCKVTTVGLYGILLVYCKFVFQDSFLKAMLSIYLSVVVLTIIQFICLMLVNCFIHDNEVMRALVSNIIILLFSIFLLPRLHIEKLRDGLCGNRTMRIVLDFIGTIILFLLLQDKIFKGIQAELFIFAIPLVAVTILVLAKWNKEENHAKQVEKELENNLHMQEKYANILSDVRLRQHEFKNHIAAIFSTHYTYKTYEKLVQAQREYCEQLVSENRHNNLLLIGNNVLAGFLYGKFQEIEDEGIKLEYKIHSQITNISITTYHLIEMIGILLNNAVEALKNSEEKVLSLEILEKDEKICFIIRNVHCYVGYSEFEQWFREGISSKGKNRGLGLYHVKEICREYGGNICCKNVSLDNKNWIQFELEIMKDSQSL